MNSNDQHCTLERLKADIVRNIEALKSGYMFTTNGLTKERAIRNEQRRLKRLEKRAADWKIELDHVQASGF